MRNIPYQFEISIYNTLCYRGPPKVLVQSRKNARGGHLVFQNEAKNIPRQYFMIMNISCKFEKASYNIFFVRVVTVKSLYTLRRRGRNKAKSTVSTGCHSVDTMSVNFKCTHSHFNVQIMLVENMKAFKYYRS